jgi:hypothetical protein
MRQALSVVVLSVFLFSIANAVDTNESLKKPSVKSTQTDIKANKKALRKTASKKKAATKKVVPKIVKEADQIKKDLIAINKELYRFEEDLLYPTNTQLAVFLSLSSDSTFVLDSIDLLLDDKLVSSHLYKGTELNALKKGGVQRIYLGSLADGKHKLTAQFNGQGANNSYFRRKKALKFNKEHNAKFIQMEVSESSTTREPLFKVKQW